MATATAATTTELLSEADKRFGYRFGVDGVMGFDEACTFMGNISRDTLYRRIADELIRKGRHPKNGRSVVCRRSVTSYVSKLEE